jgi:hypothetical protein
MGILMKSNVIRRRCSDCILSGNNQNRQKLAIIGIFKHGVIAARSSQVSYAMMAGNGGCRR